MRDYLTGEAVARRLGVTRRTVYRWMEYGWLDATDWTVKRLDQLLADGTLVRGARPGRPLAPPIPHCSTCGCTNPYLFSRNPRRARGWAGECTPCRAARWRRARMNSSSGK